LKNYIDTRTYGSLHKEVDPRALNNLMMGTLKNWNAPTEMLFSNFKTYTITAITEILHGEEFDRWNGCGVFEKARKTIQNFIQNTFDEAKGQALHLLKLETVGDVVYSNINTYTDQASVFDSIMEKHFRELQKARYDSCAKKRYCDENPQLRDSINNGDEAPIQKMMERIAKADYKEKVGPDPFSREILVMAKMKAYYQYSASRFVELVLMTMQKGVLTQLKDVEYWLKTELYLDDRNSVDKLEELLTPDPERVRERQNLEHKSALLKIAYEELQEVAIETDSCEDIQMQDI
jgi:hypothetical protein